MFILPLSPDIGHVQLGPQHLQDGGVECRAHLARLGVRRAVLLAPMRARQEGVRLPCQDLGRPVDRVHHPARNLVGVPPIGADAMARRQVRLTLCAG